MEYYSERTNKKVNEFLDYFDPKSPKNSYDRKANSVYELEEAMKIYESDLIEIRKIDEIRKYFKRSEIVRRKFSFLEKYKNEELFGKYYEMSQKIYNFLEQAEKNGMPKIADELLKEEKNGTFDNYYIACQVLNCYLEYHDSAYLIDFYNTYDITEDYFMYYMNILDYLNPVLYEQFLKKYKEDKEKRKSITYEKYNNLLVGIKTGFLPNNEPFDKLEAFRNLPFYDEGSSREILRDFNLKSTRCIDQKLKTLFDYIDSETTLLIIDYLHNNSIVGNVTTRITEEEIVKTKYIINDVELTNKDKKAIIDYMRTYNIPFIVKAFNEVKIRHLNKTLKRNQLNK